MKLKKSDIRCCELISRRWEASYPNIHGAIGAGKTSTEAIKSLRKEIKKKHERDLRDIYQPRFTYSMGEGGQ